MSTHGSDVDDVDDDDYADADLSMEELSAAALLVPELLDNTTVEERLCTRIQNTGSGTLAVKRPLLSNLCNEYGHAFHEFKHRTGFSSLSAASKVTQTPY